MKPPWWALPTKNTLDRATSSMPKLLHERLDDMGLDFTVLYPTAGLFAPHLDDDEIRRGVSRAFNLFHADIFREYADRMTRWPRFRCIRRRRRSTSSNSQLENSK